MAEKFSSSSNFKWDFEICQLCEQPSHIAISCPWMYSKCMIRRCIRLCMLLFCDGNISKGKKYLKCQFPDCDSFIWLEDAIKGKNSTAMKCHLCGDDDHLGKDCPWEGYPCRRPRCSGWRHILTSHTEQNPKNKYLVCDKCHSFKWLSDAIVKHQGTTKQEQLLSKSPSSSRMKGKHICNDVPDDDFCEEFDLKARDMDATQR
ncbi:zinc finger protein [Macleaya cordata]|uniref:Zinc finger protein n=1 Tax=Macleaya cordata TaxID=56857 RepID=A0A200QG24_MACCD|nr:zinc finger protein [Macleaya cordata]